MFNLNMGFWYQLSVGQELGDRNLKKKKEKNTSWYKLLMPK